MRQAVHRMSGCLPRNDLASKIGQEINEAAILRGAGDGQMEVEVFLDPAVAGLDGATKTLLFTQNLLDLRSVARSLASAAASASIAMRNSRASMMPSSEPNPSGSIA